MQGLRTSRRFLARASSRTERCFSSRISGGRLLDRLEALRYDGNLFPMPKFDHRAVDMSKYERGGNGISFRIIRPENADDKRTAEKVMRKGFYEEGRIPATIRLTKAEDAGSSLPRREFDLYLNSGVSRLIFCEGRLMGSQFNAAWKRRDSFQVIEDVPGREFFEAAKAITAKYAETAAECAEMWRNFHFLFLYNHAQRLAQRQDKDWVLYTNGLYIYPQYRGLGVIEHIAGNNINLVTDTNGVYMTQVHVYHSFPTYISTVGDGVNFFY